MFAVNIFIRIPLPCEKGVLPADNFPIKERGQSWVLIGQTFDLQVSTQVGTLQVYMLCSTLMDRKHNLTIIFPMRKLAKEQV